MITRRMPKIVIFTVTLFPLSYGPGGLERALNIASDANLDGLQLVPFARGYGARSLARIDPKRIHSYESDWRKPLKPDEKVPRPELWHDPVNTLLFGSRERVQQTLKRFEAYFPHAIAIDVGFGEHNVIEVSANHEHIKRNHYPHHPAGVVFDTWHVREKAWKDLDPHELVDRLNRAGNIRLIHAQTRDKLEFEKFLNGQETVMGDLLRHASINPVDVVIELPPWFLWGLRFNVMQRKLMGFAYRIREIYR